MNKKSFILNLLAVFFIALFAGVILALTVRGLPGNPSISELNSVYWKDNGPLELSPERGRYALMYSIAENNSFIFSTDIARFVTPDLGYINGNYVSLFAPAVSYIALPGYLAGKSLGASQVGAFSVIALFGVLNAVLIYLILISLRVSRTNSVIGGLIFLFATPAFPYAVSLYQHHISTSLILVSLLLCIRYTNFWSLTLIWFLCAASIPLDYPNLFLMFPVGVFALGKLIWIKNQGEKYIIGMSFIKMLSVVSVIIPLSFFLWFNYHSYGNALQFSGTVASVKSIGEDGRPAVPETVDPLDIEGVNELSNPEAQDKSAIGFFKTRNLMQGLHTHLISLDRGIIVYTPVILLGIFGLALMLSSSVPIASVMVGVIGINLILYSMWGDPWGGWAFGSRYMIPSYAILAIGIGYALNTYRKVFFIIPFVLLMSYSIGVNTLGAITTNQVPPQVEILALEEDSGKIQKYTYERNWDQLVGGSIKSFSYQTFGYKYVNTVEYYYAITGVLIITLMIFTLLGYVRGNKKHKI
jgi:hypothetical protein